VPPGSCIHSANRPVTPDDMPDKIISTVNSILYATTAGLRSSWLASPRNGSSFLLWPEILQLAGWNRRCRARVALGTAQKKTDLVPKLNRMPDRQQGVKDTTPNLHSISRSCGDGRPRPPKPSTVRQLPVATATLIRSSPHRPPVSTPEPSAS
jgi:hypothetical protein